MSRIAIDAMGGDRGPREVVLGVVQAHERWPEIDLTLVGRSEEIEPVLKELGSKAEGIKVFHASEVVTMDDSPAEAVRSKRDSSINRCAGLVAKGLADAIVSPGNTGAVVASATLQWRLLGPIKRPGIAVSIPTSRGVTMVVDVGANIYPKPLHLCQYAAMASVYSTLIWHVEKPRIGLLNIGSENAKGTGLVREAHDQLTRSKLNFVGNLEGYDLWDGAYDVVVCEGFVGNVLLKVSEGLWPELLRQVSVEMAKQMGDGSESWMKAITKLILRYDYAEYGGAPLLGTNGICIICHGSSNAKAFMNATRLANECVAMGLNKHMLEAVEAAGFDQGVEGSPA